MVPVFGGAPGFSREVIGWHQGIEDPADKKRITQLWARANPLPENPFIDSRRTLLRRTAEKC